jgi:hypothetical protein
MAPTKLGMKASQTFEIVGYDLFVKEACQLMLAQRKLVLAPVILLLESARAHFGSGTCTSSTYLCTLCSAHTREVPSTSQSEELGLVRVCS